MFKGDWGGFVAIGLVAGGGLAIFLMVWVIGLNYCPNSPCQYDRADGDQTRYFIYDPPLARGPNTTYIFGEADQEGHTDYYNRQDLRAQESMARATNAIVIWTAVGVVTALIGMAALFYTLTLQRRSNEIARNVGIFQSQGYLHVERVDFYWGGKERKNPRVEIWIQNSGQTPVPKYWVRISVMAFRKGAQFESGGAPNSWDDVAMDDFIEQPFNAISATGEVMVPFNLAEDAADLDKALAIQWYTPDHGISLFGEVKYETFFGDKFVSQFCFGAHELREFEDGDAGEIPIRLERFAFSLDTYKKVEN